MSELIDYLFSDDDGGEIASRGLANDEVAEENCQKLANQHQCHVTCVRVICDCDPEEE